MSRRRIILHVLALALSWVPINPPAGAQTPAPAPRRIQVRAIGNQRANPARVSVWEVYPVYDIAVC